MAYINKGDLVEVDGKRAVAASADYTRLVYDSYDYEASSRWSGYEGGTAIGYVDVLYPDAARTASVPIRRVRKL